MHHEPNGLVAGPLQTDRDAVVALQAPSLGTSRVGSVSCASTNAWFSVVVGRPKYEPPQHRVPDLKLPL